MRKLPPLKAARAKCLDCMETRTEVRNCDTDTCPLWSMRLGRHCFGSRVKRIRKYCLWCMNNSAPLVKDCWTLSCPLYPYRMGKNPAMAGRRPPPHNSDFAGKRQLMGGSATKKS